MSVIRTKRIRDIKYGLFYKANLRTADVFPVVVSLPSKNNICEHERQNDFRDVRPFVLMFAI